MPSTASSFMPQHLLVTGGAGFIGANFVRWVCKTHSRTRITVLDSLTYAGKKGNLDGLLGGKVAFVHGDICNKELVGALCSRPNRAEQGKAQGIRKPPIDAIVHFAAESHNDNSIADAQPFLSANIEGTYVLLEAARRHSLRFHHISTDEVYGDMPLESTQLFTEDSPYRPSSPYAASKAGSDHLVRAWHRTYGIRATISNCSNNYGPYQHVEKFIPRQITNILSGLRPKLYGHGDAIRDWINVEDHCCAVWEVLTRGRMGQTYLIGVHGERSNLDIMRMILTMMGRKDNDFDHVDDRPGADKRYGLNARKIETELGWKPKFTDFPAGLEQTIDWYASHRAWWQADKAATEKRYSLQGH